ncbi:RsiV family protein [[Haemophilus] ducreyi]|uniref:RsiV family protein n=1 Tax=Haemophilus ducreyi TaxID=730 RepID=UPI000655DB51|nr:RsiV family protein [[Haemophilus] ducreyi]AKO44836.1 hypothetical protein RZ66_00610 [[Haemophilus] ducreyi]AKO46241.1 hypothetical protein RZ67_00605 [[Haemophilus] ducreyi]AKO47584.1 hypothetical protein RZ68_00610 [[Haemophilus] ducreyi]AKO48966.1 hypothetical protein RZ69_00605 [[Haemophilus] ducreyi]ANF61849.1 hypothetical protein A6037_03345 [[Haemophilus] ducreyi]
MQKSTLAAVLASVLFLSACDNKKKAILAEKLHQSERRVVELKQALLESQQMLRQLKAHLVQTEQGEVPSLAVEIYPFFEKSDRIKFEMNANQSALYPISSAEQHYFVSLASTGFSWLDNLLAKQILMRYTKTPVDQLASIDINHIDGDELARLHAVLARDYAENLATLKEGVTLGISSTAETIYLGQRHNIVTFSQNYDEYTGGAHNNYYTRYLNIDVNNKRIILLEDLLAKAKQVALKALLWKYYVQMRSTKVAEQPTTFIFESDFYIAEDFLFTDDGIKFIYPPYALGPFSEGEISLTVPWNEVNSLLNLAYQRTPKDGYGLAPVFELVE